MPRSYDKELGIPLELLEPGRPYHEDFFDSFGAVVIPKGTLITEDILHWVRSRGVNTIFTEDVELRTKWALKNSDTPQKVLEFKDKTPIDFPEAKKKVELYEKNTALLNPKLRINPNWTSNNPIVKNIDGRSLYFSQWDIPRGLPFQSDFLNPPSIRTTLYKEVYLKTYQDFLLDVRDLWERILAGTLVEYKPLGLFALRVMQAYLKDRYFLANLTHLKSQKKENLYHRALNTCILSIQIASKVGFHQNQVLEIAVGALVHDLGMVFVDPQIRYKDTRLNSREMAVVQEHPINGLFLLSKIKDIPESVQAIVYQHHERENGLGYPRGVRKNRIHRFARIVALADCFDALTSQVPYRTEYSPYHANLEILNMVKKGLVSGELVRFFLDTSSLFTLGSYVMLSNGKVGKVVKPNPGRDLEPLVSIMDHNKGSEEKIERIDILKSSKISITQALSFRQVKEAGLFEGF